MKIIKKQLISVFGVCTIINLINVFSSFVIGKLFSIINKKREIYNEGNTISSKGRMFKSKIGYFYD